MAAFPARLALTLPVLLAMAACGEAEGPPVASDTQAATAAPGTPEELLTRYTALSPAGEFAPRDECLNLAGAPEFRRALAQAVIARDADALVALADPAIGLDFGGGAGVDTLRARLTDPEYGLWEELEAILPLGCAAGTDGNSLTVPHYFAADIGTRDPYATYIAMGSDVPLRASAADDAEILANIGWQAVEVSEYPGEGASYASVTASDGRQGFAAMSDLRSLIDYRLLANRGDDGWKITMLVAGD
ncbi:hypothetical protein [Alteraurantiacibacter palmitatis]|uniref:SH3 domain-containing protein n=1 Tax=Alteraurantiacibacter palmitatis TaxID=2054628 RepID=A0ABV7E3J1_9SPHN